MTLTQEGRELHERTLRLLAEREAIEQAAVSARSEPAGILKVTAPLPIGIHLIAPALPAFRKRFPKLSIDLRLGDHFVDLVGEGVDVAIRAGVDTSDAVAAVMVAGRGVGITPYVAASYVKRGELVPLLTEFVEPRSTITALWPQSRRSSPNVKAFVAHLTKVFAAYAADK
ncbi:LysR substrate-binding domain-containing protein [Burkholderia ambifaria]|uniref:LysR substrate-binding domain-containing protein n=1 Tax=Burkholderia ambifaria TaxID=152480 RepID=UPI00068144CE|nr:LysR substrate-binding domain-containing protein [Burkholderia ambifaria]